MAKVLEGFPPLYYLNLKRRKDRDEHMKKLIKTYKLNGTRVEAVDGTVVGSYDNLVEATPPYLKDVQIACTISHLQTIRHWLLNSDTETAVICEDDVSFEHVEQWGVNWKEIESAFPHYWDIIQMCVIFHPNQDIIFNLHHRTMYDYSAACYMVNRRYAKKLMDLYWNDAAQCWRLHVVVPFPLTSEEAVYRPGSCLTIPLFTFTGSMGSDIQNKDHLEHFHTFSKMLHKHLWQQIKAPQLLNMWPLQLFQAASKNGPTSQF